MSQQLCVCVCGGRAGGAESCRVRRCAATPAGAQRLPQPHVLLNPTSPPDLPAAHLQGECLLVSTVGTIRQRSNLDNTLAVQYGTMSLSNLPSPPPPPSPSPPPPSPSPPPPSPSPPPPSPSPPPLQPSPPPPPQPSPPPPRPSPPPPRPSPLPPRPSPPPPKRSPPPPKKKSPPPPRPSPPPSPRPRPPPPARALAPALIPRPRRPSPKQKRGLLAHEEGAAPQPPCNSTFFSLPK